MLDFAVLQLQVFRAGFGDAAHFLHRLRKLIGRRVDLLDGGVQIAAHPAEHRQQLSCFVLAFGDRLRAQVTIGDGAGNLQRLTDRANDADAQAPGQQQGQGQYGGDNAERDDPGLGVTGTGIFDSSCRALLVQFAQQLHLHVHQVALQGQHGIGKHACVFNLALFNQRDLVVKAGDERFVSILQRDKGISLSAVLDVGQIVSEAFSASFFRVSTLILLVTTAPGSSALAIRRMLSLRILISVIASASAMAMLGSEPLSTVSP